MSLFSSILGAGSEVGQVSYISQQPMVSVGTSVTAPSQTAFVAPESLASRSPSTGAGRAPNLFQSIVGAQEPILPPQNLFSTMFLGGVGQPSVLGIPAITEDPANIFYNIFAGAKTQEEALAFEAGKPQIPDLSDFYKWVDQKLGGVLPGGEPFWDTKKIVIVAVIGLAALWLLSGRRR